MAVTIKLRGDTAANWLAANPILAEREVGLEMDTRQYKVGNGVLPWAELEYWGMLLPGWSVDENGHLIGSGDVRPGGDLAGLYNRTVNFGATPLTHIRDFSGWTWQSYGGVMGTPSHIDVTTFPDMAIIYHPGATLRAFAKWQTFGNTARTRVSVGQGCRGGVRMDNGTNNQYFEWFAETTTTKIDLKIRYAVFGVVVGPTTIRSVYSNQFIDLQLTYSPSLGGFLIYDNINSPLPAFISFHDYDIAAPTQRGIMVESLTTAGSTSRAVVFDRFGG